MISFTLYLLSLILNLKCKIQDKLFFAQYYLAHMQDQLYWSQTLSFKFKIKLKLNSLNLNSSCKDIKMSWQNRPAHGGWWCRERPPKQVLVLKIILVAFAPSEMAWLDLEHCALCV